MTGGVGQLLSCIDMCGQLTKFGDIFMSTVNESDPDHSRKIATAYDSIVKTCGGEPLEEAVRAPSPLDSRLNV